MSVSAATRFSPEDLLALPESEKYELIDGQLVEHSMSHAAVWVATQIACLLVMFLRKHPLGDVYGEGATYQCFPHDPFMVRKADVSFIRTGRLPPEQFERGHCRIAPDLAVEVISPNDLHYELSRKLEDYFLAGVPLVWLVNPETRTVTVYHDGGTQVAHLHEADRLTGEDVLPGFECLVSELFPPRMPVV